jgi:predicted HAD superfamily hydrolase
MRLNKKYQEDFDEVTEVYDEYLNATGTFDEVEDIFDTMGLNFSPYPGDTFQEWQKQHKMGELPFLLQEASEGDKIQILQVYRDAHTLAGLISCVR